MMVRILRYLKLVSREEEDKYTIFAQQYLLRYKPHRTENELKKDHGTWLDALSSFFDEDNA